MSDLLTGEYHADVNALMQRIAELEALLQRSRLQEEGVHPAPCAKHCEAAAFNIEIRRLQAENAELRAKFTKLDQPKYSGEPMLDKWLEHRNPEFTAEIEKLPPTYWARYDLSAVRIGWELAMSHLRGFTAEEAKAYAKFVDDFFVGDALRQRAGQES